MRYLSQSLFTGIFIVTILGIGLLLSLLILISPTQAEQTGLMNPSINVAATAQAIQFSQQQAELEATGQAQKTTWEAEINQLQQRTTEANQQAQTHISQLEAHLINVKAQMKQSETDLQATQARIAELEQAIQADRTEYESKLAKLESEMSQVEEQLKNQLDTASAQLQTAYEQAANSQIKPTTAVITSDNNRESGGTASDAGKSDQSGDNSHNSEDHKEDHKNKEIGD